MKSLLMKHSSKTLFLLALLFSVGLKAQDNKSELKLDRTGYPEETVYLHEKGFLIRTRGLKLGRNNTYQLLCYDAKANLKWEASIQQHYGNNAMLIAVSPSGQMIYTIEVKENIQVEQLVIDGKRHYLTQITMDGRTKVMEIAGRKAFGKSLQAVFCDDRYLYFLTTENGWETLEKKKAEERLILNRFDHVAMKWERFYFRLPPLKELKHSTFWHFLGQTEEDKYLISKRYDHDTGENFADILKFNNKAEITEHLTINFSLNGKHNRPAMALGIPRPQWEEVADLAFGRTIKRTRRIRGVGPSGNFSNFPPREGDPNTITTSRTPLLSGAFGYWYLDSQHKCLYTYGLLGPKPFKYIGPVYDGFYIDKYDLKGNLIWKARHTDVPELLEHKKFKVNRKPYERQINLKVLADETLNFSVYVVGTLFSYEITPQGQVRDFIKKEKESMPVNNLVQNASYPLKSEAYVKKHPIGKGDKKFITYSNFYSSVGEILLKVDGKKRRMEILYFGP